MFKYQLLNNKMTIEYIIYRDASHNIVNGFLYINPF